MGEAYNWVVSICLKQKFEIKSKDAEGSQ